MMEANPYLEAPTSYVDVHAKNYILMKCEIPRIGSSSEVQHLGVPYRACMRQVPDDQL